MDYIEVTFSVNPRFPGEDILIYQLSDIGYDSFDTNGDSILAYVPESVFSIKKIQELDLFKNPEFKIDYTSKKIETQNWNQVWESSFEPVIVGNSCIIKAPFHKVKDKYDFIIEIEPKMSFGTGHHQTTFLMVEKMLELDFYDKEVLDMGCGTAILGILASMKAAKNVVTIDIEEWAALNSNENGQRNGVGNMQVYQGDANLLGEQSFDIILANINRNILVRDVENYVSVLNPKGIVLMSGFFNIDVPIIKESAERAGLKFVESKEKENWAICIFKKLQ